MLSKIDGKSPSTTKYFVSPQSVSPLTKQGECATDLPVAICSTSFVEHISLDLVSY